MISCNKVFLICCVVFSIFSCSKDYEENDDLSSIFFSLDTLKYDTIFSRIPSTTKRIKIYNKSNSNIVLDQILLENNQSYYRLNVNGQNEGKYANININAQDSLYVFVEINAKYHNSDKPKEILDKLIVRYGDYYKSICLQTFIQDVIFLENEDLKTQEFTSDRPYFIIGNVNIPKSNTLTILDSTHIYFQKKSSLNVYGDILIKGKLHRPVVFMQTRLEKIYQNIPAQWDGIKIIESSKNSEIEYLICKNAINGLQIHNCEAEIKIKNSIFTNFSIDGILVNNASLKAENVLIANCGNSSVYLQGDVDFTAIHCSILNYWTFFSSLSASLNVKINPSSNCEIYNSIIYGNAYNELYMSESNANIIIENSLLKLSNEKIIEYKEYLSNNSFNTNPLFEDVKNLLFYLTEKSPARAIANTNYSIDLPYDIMGNSRINNVLPDLGCYQYQLK